MASTVWEIFGPWLQQQRELARVSQEEAALAAGIRVVQLSRIENGRSGTRRETIMSIVDAINGLSRDHRIDRVEALRKAGFHEDEGTNIDISDDVRLILLGKDISLEDREEYERAVSLAVAMAKQRIDEKNKNK
jgi:transcriptional regulator with XRE-family HTH domain